VRKRAKSTRLALTQHGPGARGGSPQRVAVRIAVLLWSCPTGSRPSPGLARWPWWTLAPFIPHRGCSSVDYTRSIEVHTGVNTVAARGVPDRKNQPVPDCEGHSPSASVCGSDIVKWLRSPRLGKRVDARCDHTYAAATARWSCRRMAHTLLHADTLRHSRRLRALFFRFPRI